MKSCVLHSFMVPAKFALFRDCYKTSTYNSDLYDILKVMSSNGGLCVQYTYFVMSSKEVFDYSSQHTLQNSSDEFLNRLMPAR